MNRADKPELSLFAYDLEPGEADSERLGRVLELKEAILAGDYDVDGEWRRLVEALGSRLGRIASEEAD